MKRIAVALVENPKFIRALDRMTAIALRAASLPFVFFERLGPARLPTSRESLRKIGVYPLRDHYYQPLFNDAHLTKPLSDVRTLPGIDWRHAEQLALLERLEFAEELRSLDLLATPKSNLDFSFGNGAFLGGDAEFLYSLIRHIKPRLVLEVGSGHSTKMAHLALERNHIETGREYDHVCIEPYEMPWLESLGVRVVRERVEDVDLDTFAALEPDDLLFIDSSHMIRPQGDVLFEYLEVLPTLASGVYVHVHDIFSPRDYPDRWIREEVRFWNEQYLLEALLSNSERYEVVAALNYLQHTDHDHLAAVCPYLGKHQEPSSFYFRIK